MDERGGLENRCIAYAVPWVRIPPPPPFVSELGRFGPKMLRPSAFRGGPFANGLQTSGVGSFAEIAPCYLKSRRIGAAMEPRSQHAQTRDGVAVAVWTLGAQEQ